MTRAYRPLTLLLILLVLALSGCTAISGEEATAGDSEQVAQATQAPEAEPTATTAPATTVAPTEEPEPTEVAIGPPPAFSEDLHATDPQTVVLGAGKPQVIEFFAFW